jgi:hypothetical protein
MHSETPPARRTLEDPLVRAGRREALIVLVVWLAALAWTVGYSTAYGDTPAAGELEFVLGFPRWVFWGVLAPWAVCIAIGFWFGLVFMQDHDLEAESSPADRANSETAEPVDA